jgi:hypothetical protein
LNGFNPYFSHGFIGRYPADTFPKIHQLPQRRPWKSLQNLVDLLRS